MAARLDLLPVLVLDLIAENLPQHDRVSLSRTSRRLYPPLLEYIRKHPEFEHTHLFARKSNSATKSTLHAPGQKVDQAHRPALCLAIGLDLGGVDSKPHTILTQMRKHRSVARA